MFLIQLQQIILVLVISYQLQCTLCHPFEHNQPKFNNRGQVVFLGDSITDSWRTTGKEIWDKFYEPLGSVNTGISGDLTANMINRIRNEGQVDGLNAYLAILKIGTNDLAWGNQEETTVVQNIGIILDLIKERNAGVRILLLAILPRGEADIYAKIRNVNQQIAAYGDNQTVFFLNMEEQFSDGMGSVKLELFDDDKLHLKSEGYQVWANTMNPLFDSILNKPFPAKAVWLGGSTTSQWETVGGSVWNASYLEVESIIVAKDNQTSGQMIEEIENNAVLDGLNSKVVTLIIGGNDLSNGQNATAVLLNVQIVIGLIQSKIPHARIILLALFPQGGKSDSYYAQEMIFNAGLAELQNSDDVWHLNMRDKFANASGQLYQDLYQDDQSHLTEMGYKVWQENIDPLFQLLLKF